MTKPRQIVIFGASGNLTRRKLLPALARIAFAGRVDPGLQIIGMSRQPMRDEEFREQLATGLSPERRKELEALAPAIHYQPGDVADPDSLVALGERLDVSPIPPRRVASRIQSPLPRKRGDVATALRDGKDGLSWPLTNSERCDWIAAFHFSERRWGRARFRRRRHP